MSEPGVLHIIRKFVLFSLTWPYYRALHRRTIEPTGRLLESKDIQDLSQNITRWIEGKDRELRDVKVAATVSLAMTVGIFSWPETANTSWYSRGFWYGSFIMAILALIATNQENILLDEMLMNHAACNDGKEDDMDRPLSHQSDQSSIYAAKHRVTTLGEKAPTATTACEQMLSHVLITRRQSPTRESDDKEWAHSSVEINETEDLQEWLQGCRVSLAMLFIWQTPLMLMSWSWVTFVVALTLHVLQPFLDNDPWGDDSKVAVMFLAFLGPGLLVFVLSAFFPYIRTKPSLLLVNIFHSKSENSMSQSLGFGRKRRSKGRTSVQVSPLSSSRAASPMPAPKANADRQDQEDEPV